MCYGALFDTMQSNAILETPDNPEITVIAPKDFFHRATSNKWEGKMSEVDMGLYAQAIQKLLTPEDTAWLEWGSMGKPT